MHITDFFSHFPAFDFQNWEIYFSKIWKMVEIFHTEKNNLQRSKPSVVFRFLQFRVFDTKKFGNISIPSHPLSSER